MEAAIDRIMYTYDLLLNRTTAASEEARSATGLGGGLGRLPAPPTAFFAAAIAPRPGFPVRSVLLIGVVHRWV